nr:hypothetical protein [Endozoicomonas sp.]
MSKHNKSGVSQKGQVAVLGIDLSKNSFQLHGGYSGAIRPPIPVASGH